MSNRRPGRSALVVAVACSLALSGCGLGAGDPPTGVSLLVTDGSGAKVVLDRQDPKTGGEDTVLQLLQRNAEIETKYSGTYVTTIGGVRAEPGGARSLDWIFYVDGIASDRGASGWTLRDGDQVWWDRQDTEATALGTQAVVGSFPAPLAGGFGDRSGAVDVRCAEPERSACAMVTSRLEAAGAEMATDAQRALPPTDRASPVRVEVGLLPEVVAAAGPEGQLLARGPKRSGVFLTVGSDGGGALLDRSGQVVARLGAGEGIVAAIRSGVRAPVWFVAGTDATGTRRAAKALTAQALHGKLAVTVGPDGVRGLPLAGPQR